MHNKGGECNAFRDEDKKKKEQDDKKKLEEQKQAQLKID
jgi:hypothetical protein